MSVSTFFQGRPAFKQLKSASDKLILEQQSRRRIYRLKLKQIGLILMPLNSNYLEKEIDLFG